MVKRLRLNKYILSILSTIFILIFPPITHASEVLFEDDFNDNIIGGLWAKKNFFNGESGTYNSTTGSLIIDEFENKLRLHGFGNRSIGWYGNSLRYDIDIPVYNDKIVVKSELQFNRLQKGTTSGITIEFDPNNRMVFNIGIEDPFRQYFNITLEENDVNRCALRSCINLWDGDAGDVLPIELSYDAKTKQVEGIIGNLSIADEFLGSADTDVKIAIFGTVWTTSNYLDVSHDNFNIVRTSEDSDIAPNLKQYSDPWGSDEYDHASQWYPNDPSMSRWGCALTSANMLMQHHNISDVNPGELNSWLKEQTDGFTRSGGVMWNTIGRYAKSIDSDSKTLEFQYLEIEPTDENIKSEIDAGNPPILKLANKYGGYHFIVASHVKDDEIMINDPGNSDNKTLSDATSYWGDVLQIGRYTPSNTDLSYIVSYIDDGFEMELSSSSGEVVSTSFNEGPIVDAQNDHTDLLGDPLETIYHPKPGSGEYVLEISGDGFFQLDTTLYDVDGNSQEITHNGLVFEDDPVSLTIQFDKQSSENSIISERETTFDSLLNDLESIYEQGKIKNHGLYVSSKRLISVAKLLYYRDKKFVSRALLTVAKEKLKFAAPKKIETQYSEYLQNEIDMLLASLNS